MEEQEEEARESRGVSKVAISDKGPASAETRGDLPGIDYISEFALVSQGPKRIQAKHHQCILYIYPLELESIKRGKHTAY